MSLTRRIALRAALPLLLGTLGGCGGAQTGGQTGEESGAGCVFTTSPLSERESSPLGFSADQVLTLVSAERSASFEWLERAGIEYGPESGAGNVTVRVTPTASARFARINPAESAAHCEDHVRIPVSVTLATGGGTFDESFEAVLLASSADEASVTQTVPSATLRGTFAFSPGARRATLSPARGQPTLPPRSVRRLPLRRHRGRRRSQRHRVVSASAFSVLGRDSVVPELRRVAPRSAANRAQRLFTRRFGEGVSGGPSMKYSISICGWLLGATLLAACGSTEGAKSPSEGGSTRQTLTASGDCSFQSCGVVPSSLSDAAKVECSATASDACEWSDDAASGSVSFRQCADAECPAKPAIECPTDTVQSSQYCGSENDAPCAWTTICVPPRITTPCPQADGCGQGVPAIGVICKDGTTGGMTCVTDGAKCFFERDCD